MSVNLLKNGELVKVSGGGGGSIATSNSPGIVQPDNSTINVDENGVISSTNIDTTARASIETLNGGVSTVGSVDYKIAQAVGNLSGFEVVPAIPVQNPNTKTIYLVKDTSVAGSDKYKEYIWNSTDGYILIGDTSIDLSNYVENTDYATSSIGGVVKIDGTNMSISDGVIIALKVNGYTVATDVPANAVFTDTTYDKATNSAIGLVRGDGINTSVDNNGVLTALKVNGHSVAKDVPSDAVFTDTQHTIVDENDVSFTKRSKLKFVNATITDDATNDTTIVKIEGSTPTYSFPEDWLIAGGLEPSSYADLEDILADEIAIRRLFTIHASVDHLVENKGKIGISNLTTIINDDYVAKWINLRDYALDTLYADSDIAAIMDAADKYFYGEWALMPQVPTLTSNTAPYGEAGITGKNPYPSTAYPYLAFTGVNQGEYDSCAFLVNERIYYKFINPVAINAVHFENRNFSGDSNLRIKSFKIQASNDGSIWTDITEIITRPSTDNAPGAVCDVTISNNTQYLYWAIYATEQFYTGFASVGCAKLQFYAWQPKGNVPVMTSNTAPYGEAISSNQYDANRANYKAFVYNDSTEDYWGTNSKETGWIGYKFTNPVCVKSFSFIQRNFGSGNTTYASSKIQASNDGTTWIDIYTIPDVIPADAYSKTTYYSFTNNNYYLYYRYNILSTGGSAKNYIGLRNLQFYGREMKGSVPTMTSNTAPYGEVIRSTNHQSVPAWQAFDGNDTTIGAVNANDGELYLGYSFIKPTVCKFIKYILPSSGSFPAERITFSYKIQGSNDGNTWVDIIQDSIGTSVYSKVIEFDNNNPYNMYRLYSTTGNGNGTSGAYTALLTLQFYGLDYSEYDWDTDNPRHYIYDHGVELEGELTSDGWSSSYNTVSGTKEPSQLYLQKLNNTTTFAVLATPNKIDVSSYNLIRAVLGNKISTDQTAYGFIGSAATKKYDSTSIVARIDLNASNISQYNTGIDISSVNQSIYIYCGSGYNNRSLSVTELWLE